MSVWSDAWWRRVLDSYTRSAVRKRKKHANSFILWAASNFHFTCCQVELWSTDSTARRPAVIALFFYYCLHLFRMFCACWWCDWLKVSRFTSSPLALTSVLIHMTAVVRGGFVRIRSPENCVFATDDRIIRRWDYRTFARKRARSPNELVLNNWWNWWVSWVGWAGI